MLVKIFRESKELKREIVDRSTEFRIPFKYICDEVGISYKEFMQEYINVPGIAPIEITDEQIIKTLEVLGIEIRHQFVINSTIDMNKLSRELEDKYRV